MCLHESCTLRVRKRDEDGEPTHVAWQCDDCLSIVVRGAGHWVPRCEWVGNEPDWLEGTGKQMGLFR